MKDTKILFNYPGFEKIEENIWVIRNFLSKEEIKAYVDIAEQSPEENWWKQGGGWYEGKVLALHDTKVYPVAVKVVEKFKTLFEKSDQYTFGSPVSIHRMKPGDDMFVHADYQELDSVEEDYVLSNVALYHNEFEGGALYYPGVDYVEYKPQPGDLLMHPGTTKYRHGVRKVTGDKTRYMSNLWMADDIGMSLKISGNA